MTEPSSHQQITKEEVIQAPCEAGQDAGATILKQATAGEEPATQESPNQETAAGDLATEVPGVVIEEQAIQKLGTEATTEDQASNG